MFDHSLRKANISLGVLIAVMVGGRAIIGLDAREVEIQLVTVLAFISGFVCLFWLYHREDRRLEQADRDVREQDATRGVD